MLTIFTSPKPFTNSFISMIQRNAIQSWMALQPKCNIILFGNEPGIADVAAEYNLRYVSDVEYKNGKPLVRALFRKAEELSDSDVFAYINSDIILLSDFLKAISKVQNELKENAFLIVGRRCNLEVKEPIDFMSPSWETRLCDKMDKSGVMAGPGAIDCFIFTRGLWPDIPLLTIGRVGFDNWLIYEARRLGVKVINATHTINIIHQHHVLSVTNEPSPKIIDKTAFDEWFWKRRKSPEAIEQIRLAGGNKCIFTIDDANWVLEPEGLRERKQNKSFFFNFTKIFRVLKNLLN